MVAACQPLGPNFREQDSTRQVTARLLVQPRPGLTLEQFDEILKSHGARRVGFIHQINVHVVELPPHANARAVVLKLRENPHIASVEVDARLPPL